MTKTGAFLSVFLFFLFCNFSYSQIEKKLVIIHTNDMHSRLDGYSPSVAYSPLSINDDRTVGGFSRIATIIKNEKLKNNTLVVDAGDFLMGTIYHYMEEYNGFQIPLMRDMGYDAMAIGNHEFDYGPDKLGIIIEKSLERGDIPQLLLSNGVFSDEEAADDRLARLSSESVIARTIIIEKDGIKVGLFSLLGKDADDVAPKAAPLSFSKQIKSAKTAVKELESKGADLIICLSHSGVERDKKGAWGGEDVKLARKVKGIDLIISGHTHTLLESPIMVGNTPIVQTGSEGRNVGRVELAIKDGVVKLIDNNLIPVNDAVIGDASVQKRIDYQKSVIADKLFKPMGYDPSEVILESAFELRCDEYGGNLDSSNLGHLIADAIHNYINENSPVGTDISMVATGVIRDNISAGKQSVQDIFRIMSLGSGNDNIPGYPLATVYLSGIELKRVVEILLVASKSTPSNHCFYSGLEVDYYPDKGLLKKVKRISIVDTEGGLREVSFDKKDPKLYSVSANSYMLEFIGVIKKTTLGLVNVFPKDAKGNPISDISASVIDFDPEKEGIQEGKEWIALVEFLKNMKDLDNNGIADIDKFYKDPPLRIKAVSAN